jgi:hypothetical protein
MSFNHKQCYMHGPIGLTCSRGRLSSLAQSKLVKVSVHGIFMQTTMFNNNGRWFARVDQGLRRRLVIPVRWGTFSLYLIRMSSPFHPIHQSQFIMRYKSCQRVCWVLRRWELEKLMSCGYPHTRAPTPNTQKQDTSRATIDWKRRHTRLGLNRTAMTSLIKQPHRSLDQGPQLGAKCGPPESQYYRKN